MSGRLNKKGTGFIYTTPLDEDDLNQILFAVESGSSVFVNRHGEKIRYWKAGEDDYREESLGEWDE